MPADGMDLLRGFDAVYLGAVGYPGVPDHISLGGLLLRIRRGFDEYINLRPIRLLKGAPCPLADVRPEDVNMIVVRENSEGEYANVGARLYSDTEREVAFQTAVFSRHGCERVIRYAFELARHENVHSPQFPKEMHCVILWFFWDEVLRRFGQGIPRC